MIFKKLQSKDKFIKFNYYLKQSDAFSSNEYIILIIFITIISIYVFLTSNIYYALLTFIMSVVFLHLIIYKKYVEKKNKIQLALCDIQDIVYFQSKIGTPTDVILASASKIAKEPLKSPIEKASSMYKVTRDLNKSLQELFNLSNIVELKAFIFTLLQREQTGMSEENHKAQSIMMKRNKRLKKRINREVKRNKLVIASILLFLCYTFLLVTPILRDALNGINKIIK